MLIYSDKYRGYGKQKPRQWGPVSAVRSAVWNYYENKLGVDSPAMVFPFWENAGTIHNISDSSEISLGSGASWVRQAVKSDGTSNGRCIATNYPTIKTSSGDGVGDFSVLAVAYVTLYATARKTLICNRIANNNKHWEIRLNSAADGNVDYGNIAFLTSDGTMVGVSGEAASLEGFKTLMGVRLGGGLRVYEDGVQIAVENAYAPRNVYSASQGFAFHGLPDSTAIPNNGSIYYVALFNFALTPNQIAQEYATPYAAIQPRIAPVYFFPASGVEPTYITANCSWKILSDINKEIAWRILNSVNDTNILAWNILDAVEKTSSWKVLDAVTEDTGWKVLSAIDKLSSWKVFSEKEKSAGWKILTELDKQIVWSILTTIDKDTAWQILSSTELSKELAWKILADVEKSNSWKILATNAKESSWKILTDTEKETTWKTLAGITREYSWSVLAEAEKNLGWRLLSAASKAMAWKVLADVEKDLSWSVLTSFQRETAWQILSVGILSQAIAWKVFNSQDRALDWRVLADTIKETACKILNAESRYVAWDILTSLSKDLSWSIMSEAIRSTGWKVFNVTGKDASWRILSGLTNDAEWKIFNATDREIMWRILTADLPQPIESYDLKAGTVFAFNLKHGTIFRFTL